MVVLSGFDNKSMLIQIIIYKNDVIVEHTQTLEAEEFSPVILLKEEVEIDVESGSNRCYVSRIRRWSQNWRFRLFSKVFQLNKKLESEESECGVESRWRRIVVYMTFEFNIICTI